MKKRHISPIVVLLIIIGVIGALRTQFMIPDEIITEEESITIASFNIQVFGRAKRSKPRVMEVLARLVREFDIVFVQEIRDSSETTAPIFLEYINEMDGPTYAFIRSKRLGRSSSKEAYAYFYNTDTVAYLDGTAHVWDDSGDIFEREPYIASFTSNNFDFTLLGIHTKPDDAENEIGNLTHVSNHLKGIQSDQDIILLGDFNADGSYYDEDDMSTPLRDSQYYWTVDNHIDTMTKTDWTYDRIVMLETTYSIEYIEDSTEVFYFNDVYGLNQTFTEDISDHFPVYAHFKTTLTDDD